jgi:hypothetical protein
MTVLNWEIPQGNSAGYYGVVGCSLSSTNLQFMGFRAAEYRPGDLRRRERDITEMGAIPTSSLDVVMSWNSITT